MIIINGRPLRAEAGKRSRKWTYQGPRYCQGLHDAWIMQNEVMEQTLMRTTPPSKWGERIVSETL